MFIFTIVRIATSIQLNVYCCHYSQIIHMAQRYFFHVSQQSLGELQLL